METGTLNTRMWPKGAFKQIPIEYTIFNSLCLTNIDIYQRVFPF